MAVGSKAFYGTHTTPALVDEPLEFHYQGIEMEAGIDLYTKLARRLPCNVKEANDSRYILPQIWTYKNVN